MERDTINKIYQILNNIPVTEENREEVEEIKKLLADGEFIKALEKMKTINITGKKQTNSKNKENNKKDTEINKINEKENSNKEEEKEDEEENEEYDYEEDNEEQETYSKYPQELSNIELEHKYIGILLYNPKNIVKYYFLKDECYFEDEQMLNIYKSIIFTEGEMYTTEVVKKGFNFSKDSAEVYELKTKLKKEAAKNHDDMEKIYIELKKLFILRRNYVQIPIKDIQEKIVEITKYILYDEMSVEEVENAVVQVNATNKFKRAILNENLTRFLELGENNLTNGLEMPFPILSSVFKGIRRGETMAFAMPSNAGKSRFTINLAAYTAFINKKKVLIISNEMSEEKMRLCLITTILNNPEIQKIHGQNLKKTEGEILEFKFRPDNKSKVKVDKEGFIVQLEGESRKDYLKRLLKESSEFKKTITATEWVNEQIENSIYFINITDHTNDELRKVIMNYYYKEKIEYIFYDTLKPDTANIGIGEELKKTATILSNLAQNFNLFICSSLQLGENSTPPINLDVNDLAVSRTVKEVLDTLCLIKQINSENYQDYEYSLKEVDKEYFDLEKYEDPNVRYYACVVDKNRAGAKPKLLFRLNLAYNIWEELGYLRLKQR